MTNSIKFVQIISNRAAAGTCIPQASLRGFVPRLAFEKKKKSSGTTERFVQDVAKAEAKIESTLD